MKFFALAFSRFSCPKRWPFWKAVFFLLYRAIAYKALSYDWLEKATLNKDQFFFGHIKSGNIE